MIKREILKYFFYFWFSQYFLKTEATGAEVYTTQSFELIRHSSYPHFVMFYAPWCGHCKRMQPLWDKYAEEKEHLKTIKIAKVDCTLNTPLCASEGIKAYPTLRLFNNQEKYTFRGNRNIGEFKQFVEENLSMQVLKPTETSSTTFVKQTEEDNSAVQAQSLSWSNFKNKISEHYTFVDFYAPWCSHCIKLEPVWNQLATRFKHSRKITIAKVDCTTEKDLCKEQNIQAYPSLNLYKDGVMISQYKKERTFKSLVSFVEDAINYNVLTDEHAPPQKLIKDEHAPPQKLIKEEVSGISIREKYKELILDEFAILFHIENAPVIVFFYISSSIEGLEVFVEFSKELVGVVPGIVNCEDNEELCTKISVRSYPKIIFFVNTSDYFPYFGDITKVGLHAFVKPLKNQRLKGSKEEL